MVSDDRTVLRELAGRYADIARDPVQEERRALWRDHNGLVPTRPLIYARLDGSVATENEVPDVKVRECRDPSWHHVERWFRMQIYRASVGDDAVFEPWYPLRAVFRSSGWGLGAERVRGREGAHAFKVKSPIGEPEDIEGLRVPVHEIDEDATGRWYARLQEAIGDIIEVDLDRTPAYTMWGGDIATEMGCLRGIDYLLTDVMIQPEWMHRFAKFLADGVEKAQAEGEAAGDWGLSSHLNQSIPYARELEQPRANRRGVTRKALWGYMASQEFELIPPAMHEEFLFRYQKPILEKYGLVAYGCCEDLTHKIDMLRQLPNLRRIAVAPRADLRSCAEQIGIGHVISWRPNPAEMICLGCDRAAMRRKIAEGLRICRGLHVDVCLKDVTTVQNEPARFGIWVEAVREAIDQVW